MAGGRPPIRPNPLDPGIIDRICEGLVEGKSMKAVCKPDDMPDYVMVYRAMARDADFATAIAHARTAQQEAIIDATIEMADEATPETVNVQKLRIWARQWRAAKLAPKKYGDKVSTEISGPDGGAIKTEDVTDMAAAARKVAFVLAAGLAGPGKGN